MQILSKDVRERRKGIRRLYCYSIDNITTREKEKVDYN